MATNRQPTIMYAKVLYKLNRAGEADVLYAKIRTLGK
jgi:hypothetical protein